ncbi:MAG: tryptophan synthase subunit alpha [Clostridiales bacterium]|nr:tryptophan synthase subunit alpha [Clostridiales bacterium]
MSNIYKAFENGKAFIPFITCGDPDLETTEKIVREMEKNGADLIELGIPFSDPTAEGPVIQEANIRALTAGTTTDKVFDMVRKLRSGDDRVKVPMVFMTYANVVFSYGAEKFISTCSEIGIDGLILPDIPYEEKGEFIDITDRFGLDLISLIAPTSEGRISRIASEAKGFIYVVSSLGVTGVRSSINTDIGSVCEAIKQSSSVPCAIGFGISTPEQAAAMASFADGVIVGSAIVRLIAANGRNSAPVVGEYVKSMKDAIR